MGTEALARDNINHLYEWMFPILFDIIYLRYFLQNRTIFLLLDKLLPDSVMASSRSEENVVLNNLQHKGVSVLVYPNDFIWAY